MNGRYYVGTETLRILPIDAWRETVVYGYRVMSPTGFPLTESWPDRSTAEQVCRLINEAYEAGRSDAATESRPMPMRKAS